MEGFGTGGFYFENKTQLLEQLQSDLAKKSKSEVIVLVKASRSSGLESIVQALHKGAI